jgi:hypothetical protein
MGVVGGSRSYDGPGLGSAPWECPVCKVPNTGDLSHGCASCGSGSARPQHVGQPSIVKDMEQAAHEMREHRDLHLTPGFAAVKGDLDTGMRELGREATIREIAQVWVERNPVSPPIDAFVAGYKFALAQAQAHTMTAPPVTADLISLAPEGKVRRTIIAALELFKDQVLRDAAEEIASGEWCSVQEAEQVIQQLKDEEAGT